ncbi:Hypp9786 [Branchiostoma lanceolatum]|uniref:Hypp9786 protein n=1 Tax=Branchiostoma lanceolatum TaxID=7740 RepID=A0A8S4MPI4_BRALA|nr:Hypp9786 [Branchiostoma lanceolatum]
MSPHIHGKTMVVLLVILAAVASESRFADRLPSFPGLQQTSDPYGPRKPATNPRRPFIHESRWQPWKPTGVVQTSEGSSAGFGLLHEWFRIGSKRSGGAWVADTNMEDISPNMFSLHGKRNVS